jgi:hypothetical protein
MTPVVSNVQMYVHIFMLMDLTSLAPANFKTDVQSVVGKVTVTPLQSYITSYIFIAVTSNCSGTVTPKVR